MSNTLTGNPLRSLSHQKELPVEPRNEPLARHGGWIGGYPFETEKPEEVFDFNRRKGFHLQRMTTCGGSFGCNQHVLQSTDGIVIAAFALTRGGGASGSGTVG